MKKRASSSSKPKAAKKVASKTGRKTAARPKARTTKKTKKITAAIAPAVLPPKTSIVAKVSAFKDFVFTKPEEPVEIFAIPVVGDEYKNILPVPLDETPQGVRDKVNHKTATPYFEPDMPEPEETHLPEPVARTPVDESEIMAAALEERLSLEGKRIIVRVGVMIGMVIILSIWAYTFRQVVSSPPTAKTSDREFQSTLDQLYRDVNTKLNNFSQPPTSPSANEQAVNNSEASSTQLTPEQLEILKNNLPASKSTTNEPAGPTQP